MKLNYIIAVMASLLFLGTLPTFANEDSSSSEEWSQTYAEGKTAPPAGGTTTSGDEEEEEEEEEKTGEEEEEEEG